MAHEDALLRLLDAAGRAPAAKRDQRANGTKEEAEGGGSGASRTVQAQVPKHYVEALTGIKVKLPKVSGTLFKEQLAQLTYVPLDKARTHSGSGPWLTVGVVVSCEPAATANGQPYSRWQLSDLRGGEVRAMLFGEAHGAFKSTPEGTVAAILGGKGKDPQFASLSVSHPSQVQLLATSAGFGFCQGITKAGERCRRAVDKTVSCFCEWHALSQARAIKADMRSAASIGATAAAAAAGLGGSSSTSGGGAIPWPGGGSSGVASGGGGGGVGTRFVAQRPALGGVAAVPAPAPPFNPAAVPGAVLGGPHGAALTHQQQQRREAARLAGNRARLVELVKQRGGLPAPDFNRTRPPSPPRAAVPSQSGQPRPGTRAASCVGGGGAAGVAAGAAGRAAPARAQGAVARRNGPADAGGSGGAKGAAAAANSKRAKLLSSLGVRTNTAGGGGPAPAAKQAVATHQKQQQPQQKKQQPAPGSAAAAFQAAFGSVLAGAPAVDEAEAARLKALADAQKDQDLDKLLAHYEKKDAVAQQLEGITKMEVTAFRCKACGTLGEKRRPECSSHDVERLKAAKRWFKCRACGWRVTTLNAPVPTRRCPHCRDPAAEYDRTTPFVAPRGDKAGDAALFAGFASREGMLARGVEHDFSLSSFH